MSFLFQNKNNQSNAIKDVTHVSAARCVSGVGERSDLGGGQFGVGRGGHGLYGLCDLLTLCCSSKRQID